MWQTQLSAVLAVITYAFSFVPLTVHFQLPLWLSAAQSDTEWAKRLFTLSWFVGGGVYLCVFWVWRYDG
jgi:hypothetical protein